MDENPKNGADLGKIWVVTSLYAPTFTTVIDSSKSPIYIDELSGEMIVRDKKFFDYERNENLIIDIKVQVADSVAITKVLINLKDRAEVNPMIQERIDNGETPFGIYKSDITLLDSLYGAYYKEGYLFHLDTVSGQGIICAEKDYLSTYWGCGKHCSTEKEIGSGKRNLDKIVAICPQANMASRAVNYTLGGHTDWFLPSLDGLRKMYNTLHAKGIGDFQNERYWSSSQFGTNGYNVYYVLFGTQEIYSYANSEMYILRMARFVD